MAVLVVLTLAHFGWKYSGSGQWEKIAERNGVVMYAMKTPGSSVKKFKAVYKIRSKQSRLVMWVNDTNRAAKDRPMGLYDLRHLERSGDRVSWTAYKQRFAPFMKPREFVLKTEFAQDPKTKALLYNVTGYPDRIPEDDCCVRVPVMKNRWTFTPLKNGELAVEWFCDMDLGGAVPALLQNTVMPQGMLTFAPKVERFMEEPKYKNAKYEWLQEPQS
nr:hypothetical protein [uncultured bacterium]